jgi:hypothetical protein
MVNSEHGPVQETLQTREYRFLFNEAGMLAYRATEEQEDEELDRSQAIELSFTDVLALSAFAEQHRDQFTSLELQLEQTWRMVSDELIDSLEALAQGSVIHATSKDIQNLLYDLGPVTFHGYQSAKSKAGRWYQSLWTSNSSPTTFGQQWVPFLRVFHQRRRERFPEKYDEDGALLEQQE